MSSLSVARAAPASTNAAVNAAPTPRLWPWVLAIVTFWLAGACVMPVVTDEAYYFLWGRYPDWGYFDHPPFIAWLTAAGQLAPASALAGRLGTLAAAVLTVAAQVKLYRTAGLGQRGGAALWAAVVLANFNVFGLVFGFITTPDTPLLLCWTAALAAAAVALRGGRAAERYWLLAGAATGAGLLAKYTMLLIGPVFLWALVAATRRGPSRGLRSPWPYAGGLVALLVWSPHLAWNARHDWVSLTFQLRHGLSLERANLTADQLSVPLAPAAASAEARLAAPFIVQDTAEATAERRPRVYDAALAALNRYAGYYASQVGLWGALALALAAALWRRRRSGRASSPALDAAVRPLLAAATAVPLLVCGLLSLASKIEANWSAMYVIGAAGLLAPLAAEAWADRWWRRLFTGAAAANLVLAGLALLHTRQPFLPVRAHRDRLLVETHGYAELAGRLAELPGPVFADSYQIGAMTRFYAPGLVVRQWPGITRDSEFLRRPELADMTPAALRAHGAFWLVTRDLVPPRLPGFTAQALTQLRDCKDDGLQVITTQSARKNPERRCKTPIHTWFIVRYATP